MSEFKVGDRVMVPAVVTGVLDNDHQFPIAVTIHQLPAICFAEGDVIPAPSTPTGKTVKVRAAVCVADDGRWAVAGATDWSDATSRAHARFFGPSDLTNFIEADVPLPDPQTIPGKVVPSDE